MIKQISYNDYILSPFSCQTIVKLNICLQAYLSQFWPYINYKNVLQYCDRLFHVIIKIRQILSEIKLKYYLHVFYLFTCRFLQYFLPLYLLKY